MEQDLLKIKIKNARSGLSEESRNAIDTVDWKSILVELRKERGFSYTQLDELETETELLLCGLLTPQEYPNELEKRMNIPKAQTNELIEEINQRIFTKIREELIKNLEASKNKEATTTTESHKEELLHAIEKTNTPKEEVVRTPSIFSQKMSGSFQIPSKETEHSVPGVRKTGGVEDKAKISRVDPYREVPE